MSPEHRAPARATFIDPQVMSFNTNRSIIQSNIPLLGCFIYSDIQSIISCPQSSCPRQDNGDVGGPRCRLTDQPEATMRVTGWTTRGSNEVILPTLLILSWVQVGRRERRERPLQQWWPRAGLSLIAGAANNSSLPADCVGMQENNECKQGTSLLCSYLRNFYPPVYWESDTDQPIHINSFLCNRRSDCLAISTALFLPRAPVMVSISLQSKNRHKDRNVRCAQTSLVWSGFDVFDTVFRFLL